MPLKKKELTKLERDGLVNHGLAVGEPSQLSDCFRLGIEWALSNSRVVMSTDPNVGQQRVVSGPKGTDLNRITTAFCLAEMDYVVRKKPLVESDDDHYHYLFFGKPEDAAGWGNGGYPHLNFETSNLDHLLRCGYKFIEFENWKVASYLGS